MLVGGIYSPSDRLTVARVATSTLCTAMLLLNDKGRHPITVASRSFLHAAAEAAIDGNKIRPDVISAERVSFTFPTTLHCSSAFLPEHAQVRAGMCRSGRQAVCGGGWSENLAIVVN